MSDRSSEQAKGQEAVSQSDNLAHAFAGAGGGLLSMIVTYVAEQLVIATKRNG